MQNTKVFLLVSPVGASRPPASKLPIKKTKFILHISINITPQKSYNYINGGQRPQEIREESLFKPDFTNPTEIELLNINIGRVHTYKITKVFLLVSPVGASRPGSYLQNYESLSSRVKKMIFGGNIL